MHPILCHSELISLCKLWHSKDKHVNPEDAQSIARLEARCRDCHAAMCLAREVLIEALGDYLCGSGDGPSPEAVWAFQKADFLEAMALYELETYKDTVANK